MSITDEAKYSVHLAGYAARCSAAAIVAGPRTATQQHNRSSQEHVVAHTPDVIVNCMHQHSDSARLSWRASHSAGAAAPAPDKLSRNAAP
jgi:hypothetical protein